MKAKRLVKKFKSVKTNREWMLRRYQEALDLFNVWSNDYSHRFDFEAFGVESDVEPTIIAVGD